MSDGYSDDVTQLVDSNIQSSPTRSYQAVEERHSIYYSSYVVDLNRSLSQAAPPDGSNPPPVNRRSLGWLGGVFAAVALAQFSTNLFLRVGK